MEAQDGNTSPAKKISYIRPSDRSPEKDFHSKDDESKINACLLRSSVNKARQKINNLRDEVEKRCLFIPVKRFCPRFFSSFRLMLQFRVA